MTTAIVLSGGGSRGDFQLGALTALYEAGVRPDIVCATSVGALNALMLTQGEGGLEDLRKIWFGLRRNDHMWLFEDWWQDIDPALRKVIMGSFMGNPAAGEPASVALGTLAGGALGSVFGPLGMLTGAMVGAATAGNTNNAIADAFTGNAVRQMLCVLNDRARSLLNLNPIRELMGRHFDAAKLEAFIAAGKKLRLAIVGLESGELCYVTEAGTLLRRRTGQELSAGISVMEGAIASSSIATVFPPVNFAGDAWVDGGHRENVPLRAAIEAGATDIYVVCSGPVDRWSAVNRTEDALFDQPPPTDFESRRILDIASRALLGIHLDEMEADDVYPAMDENPRLRIKLIYPEYPSHDIVTIDPELIRVNYDYGYRTALDTLRDAPEAMRAASTRIAVTQGKASRLRKQSWTGNGVPWSSRIIPLMAEAAAHARARTAQGLSISGPGADQSFSQGTELIPGELMLPGQSITSPDGLFTMIHQTDGHLVVYRRVGANAYAEVVWASGKYGFAPGVCVMQRDGNLVVYDADRVPRWASGTNGKLDLALRLQIDGSIVLHKNNKVEWSSRQATPGPVPPVKVVTIVNTSAASVQVRFYDVTDTVLAFTLGNGDQSVPAGGSLAWPLPANLAAVQVTFNGRGARNMAAGESFTYAVDERVHVANRSTRAIRVRIFDATDLLRAFALPGGEFSVAAGSEVTWVMPQNISRAVVVINGRWVHDAVRGALIVQAPERDDRIIVRNLSGLPVTARFNKHDDMARWFTLPGGDLNVAPQAEAAFSAPTTMAIIQVLLANQRLNANIGETLIVNPDGSITRS